MNFFKSSYRFLEQHFFQTLTRKLVGNITLLMVMQLLLFGVIIGSLSSINGLLDAAGGPDAEQLAQVASRTLWQSGLVLGISLLATIGCLLFLLYLVVRPVRNLNRQLAAMNSGEINLSNRLEVRTEDEFKHLAENYNRFLDELRETIHRLRRMGIDVAVGSTNVLTEVKDASSRAEDQGELANQVFNNSHETTGTLEHISDSTQQIASSTSDNLDSARSSFAELQSVNSNMEQMLEQIKQHDRTIKEMGDKSRDISKIVSLIQGISFQTELLSLNAAVEAARAGEAGKGFSVVATEVKKLAEEANQASEQIAGQIHGMLGSIDSALKEAETINLAAESTMAVSRTTSDNYQKLIKEFDDNYALLTRITASVEQISAANQQTHGNISQIRDLSRIVGERTRTSEQVTTNLQNTSEALQQLVARFITGEGRFEEILESGRVFRDEATAEIEQMLQEGLNIHDTNYQEIPGTAPQKYSTSYDRAFADRLQPLYDRILALIPAGIFAICVDRNGYGPTHNSQFTRPLTGNPEQDMVSSRDKRLFNDPTGLRAARNTEKFLLQTYRRDTGEILSDLSLPIHIGGRHWGGIRLGFNPQVLLEQLA